MNEQAAGGTARCRVFPIQLPKVNARKSTPGNVLAKIAFIENLIDLTYFPFQRGVCQLPEKAQAFFQLVFDSFEMLFSNYVFCPMSDADKQQTDRKFS